MTPAIIRQLIAIMTVIFAVVCGSLNAWGYNPHPAEDDLILPLPGGNSMVFRPVFIGEGDAPFALKKFKMGDTEGGFKENPTAVLLGGSFVGRKQDQKDWLFYMGKYEVTREQYDAVMALHTENPPAPLKNPTFPATGISWFETLTFIDTYNQWLFVHAKENLPKNENLSGFVRLPTEIEWEFSARGGINVTETRFDQKHPYSGNLSEFEWFAGPSSSHNQMQPSGLLKPNPIGLHDMLGNVSEMTASIYQIEYYQGRSGGFTARGGSFLTEKQTIRSSLRNEEPFYIAGQNNALEPNRKPTLGFRLVLTSVIYPNWGSVQKLSRAWQAYRTHTGADSPAAVSVEPTSVQTQLKGQDAMHYFSRLKQELNNSPGLSAEAQRQLNFLENAITEVGFVKKQAEEDSAYAWAKIAAEQGFFIYRELKKLPTLEKLLAVAESTQRTAMAEKYKERQKELLSNIEQALSTYSDSFNQLLKINATAVSKGFQRYIQFLAGHDAAEQMRIFDMVRNHFAVFKKSKRADPVGWRDDFEHQ